MIWPLWLLVLVAGVAGAAAGSRAAVAHAIGLAERFGVSAGLVGITIVAIGTDLPEIANSISASATGHGDVVVGDTTGSALAQITLVLAILILANPAGFAGELDDDGVVRFGGGIAAVAVLLTMLLIIDGELGRLDGLLLVAVWVASMIGLARSRRPRRLLRKPPAREGPGSPVRLLGWLAVVGGSSVALVQAFVQLADTIGVPELIASTMVLALGTSLPEFVVDWTALRRGAATLALGDLFGSSLVDATLSIGIGPVIRPIDVSNSAIASVAIVAAGIAVTT
ncbi:MAG: sodium:calcium antiporter, partial [Ilumatobacter sp.]|nr:sodium:calcium antiporter [Ilumatobacter sp.]